ncbi:MAG: DUF302 domain-containing protein [Xanthomonadales bacterium]|nr:DUF302 domain-containing protein [Xanthomonadales bacterium]
MYYIRETEKPFEQAAEDLDAAVKAHQFGVLHVHDLGNTLRSKGIAFAEQCRVFEVCNPGQAAKVLSNDMSMNMALPCRISVYTEKGKTKIGMIRPEPMLGMLSHSPELGVIAAEVEVATKQMINEAAG